MKTTTVVMLVSVSVLVASTEPTSPPRWVASGRDRVLAVSRLSGQGTSLAGHVVAAVITDASEPIGYSRVSSVTDIVQDIKGRYWLNGRQLWMYEEVKSRWVNCYAQAFTDGATIQSSKGIAEDPDGRIWALGRLGPDYFD